MLWDYAVACCAFLLFVWPARYFGLEVLNLCIFAALRIFCAIIPHDFAAAVSYRHLRSPRSAVFLSNLWDSLQPLLHFKPSSS